MEIRAKVLILFYFCLVTMVHLTTAMYGLCSTEHNLNNACNDNNDRCAKAYNGTCIHGAGDHNEGCQCIVESFKNGKLVRKIMRENHLPITITSTTAKTDVTTANKAQVTTTTSKVTTAANKEQVSTATSKAQVSTTTSTGQVSTTTNKAQNSTTTNTSQVSKTTNKGQLSSTTNKSTGP